jgi:hypothetical protein
MKNCVKNKPDIPQEYLSKKIDILNRLDTEQEERHDKDLAISRSKVLNPEQH